MTFFNDFINFSYTNILLSLILIVLIVLIILILKHFKMTRYLNYNSTFLGGSSKFNPSDVNYYDNIELKMNEENVKNYLLNFVNAPDGSFVIFNSGATESIANMMMWAKNISPFGSILGSELDHPSVKINADNFGMKYNQIELSKSKKINIPDGTVMIFITNVSPSTGEIFPINNINTNYAYLDTNGINDDYYDVSEDVRQIKPLKVLDASQSIGKIKIDMKNDDLNAVFFSTHKIGGNFNHGVLIVNPSIYKFKPLIAGSQQDEMRGGTYDSYDYLNLPTKLREYSNEFDLNECKEVYKLITEELDKNKIPHYKPKLEHLYDTVLVQLKGCNAKLVYSLSVDGIYVGSSTACQSDHKNTELRISYINKCGINKKVINKIINAIKQIDEENEIENEIENDEHENEIENDENEIDKLINDNI